MNAIHTQLLDLLKAFSTNDFETWFPFLDKSPDLKAYLYRNRLLNEPSESLKDHCKAFTKALFLERGEELGTDEVRKRMNEYYFQKMENFLLVEFLESLDQESADALLKNTKTLDKGE